ncbi:MAG: TIGR01897 family CRISPR-associated protein [Thermosipho sp. (in: Bacteria)]|nr:TIGR01897 family CRISPR-associated protein [Thermosipho sp. (in: thermotogales)]
MKLLITMLGLKKIYQDNVKYYMKFDEMEAHGNFLPKTLIDFFGIEKTSVFILDTLVSFDINGFDYEQLINLLKEDYSEYFRTHAQISNFDMFVIPGVGTFNDGKYEYRGAITDSYFMTLYYLYKIFSSEDVLNSEKLEVVFDITFGINFQSNILYRALIDVLQLLAYFKHVKLIVTNSEPIYLKNEKQINYLNVHVIENSEISPNINFNVESKNKFFEFIDEVTKNEKQEFGKKVLGIFEKRVRNLVKGKIESIFENSFLMLKSIYYGLPLLLILMVKKVNYAELMEEIFNTYKTGIATVKFEDNKYRIVRKLKILEGVKNIIFADLFRQYFERIFGEVKLDNITFEKLKEITESIWKVEKNSSNNTQVSIFLNKEIKKLEFYISKLEKGIFDFDLKNFNALVLKDFSTNKFDPTYDEKRNFLAHAGMSNKTFKIHKTDNNVYIIPDVGKIISISRRI